MSQLHRWHNCDTCKFYTDRPYFNVSLIKVSSWVSLPVLIQKVDLKNKISIYTPQLSLELYRSTCRKHPSKNTYKSIFKLALLYNDEPSCLLEGWGHQLVKIDTTCDAFAEGIASIPIRRTPLTIIEARGLKTE